MRVNPKIFDEIVGYEDVKELFLKALKCYPDGLPVNFLMVGDVATAKTHFLLCLSKAIKDSVYLLGSRTSRAGLTDILIERKPKVLLIDELDKADPECYGTLLSLMETGLVVKALHKQFRTERMETLVFAGANYEHELPKELLSRFMVLRFKPYSLKQFQQIAVKHLAKYKIKPRLARYMALLVYNHMNSRDMRDLIQLARGAVKYAEGRQVTRRTVNRIAKTMLKYS